MVDLAERLGQVPEVDIPSIAGGHAFSMSVADVYRQWLFHGPRFQGISRIDQIGTGGVKAELTTSSPRGWLAGATNQEWLIDPLLFDSALQLLVVWSREHWDMTALPSGFQRFRRFAAPSTSRVTCEIRIRPNTGGQTIHADIYFVDAVTGKLLSLLEDMQGSCSKALNRLAERALLAAAAGQ